MYLADLTHSNPKLENKLQRLYTLNRGEKNIDLSFRPPFMKLLEAFGNPQDHVPPTIHVAGTNGKGSTIAMLKSIYEAGGYSVHSYTSPHLIRFNERIILNGAPIKDDPLEELIDEALFLNAGREITFFEITTAMAFAAFARTPADLLLLEVGMGGRLDSTNILAKPYVSIVNHISKDHTEFLGNTIAEIAYEKGGIIKKNTPCIVGYQDSEAYKNESKQAVNTIVDIAEDKAAPLYCAQRDWSCEPDENEMIFTFGDTQRRLPRPNLLGHHQIANAGSALAALHVLQAQLPITQAALETGLKSVQWPGRLQRITAGSCHGALPSAWEIWYDGGHNDSAGKALGHQAGQWNANDPRPLHLILGMKADKDTAAFLLELLPHLASCTVIPVHGAGPCIKADMIAPLCVAQDIPVQGATSPQEACALIARQYPETDARVLIAGSLYLAEEIMK